jgi:precorrin-8X/cobalt-precorrin-8 methylmutase
MEGMMMPFILHDAPVQTGDEIESRSLAQVESECKDFPRFLSFSADEREVVKRMIHASTCFTQVIESIQFLNEGESGIEKLLSNGATIITDTTMIRSGLSFKYTDKFMNETVCLVGDGDVAKKADLEGRTRSHVAVREALLQNRNRDVILACGNAPTFLYSAIETIVKEGLDHKRIGWIAFPVGFINVTEAKEYTLKFLKHSGSPGIVLEGRFGSSPLVVSALHAIYRNLAVKMTESPK